MKVFLSWSGARSNAVAQALTDWLREVIQALDPWMSSDIDKGQRWSTELFARLDESNVGIICLTKENLLAPWILFEAGALSKKKGALVCTFLLDVDYSDIHPSLGQFQHTKFLKEDFRKLITDINSKLEASNGKPLDAKTLEKVFEKNWAELETDLSKIAKQGLSTPANKREVSDLLEEMLEILRHLKNRENPNPYAPTSQLADLFTARRLGIIEGQTKGALDITTRIRRRRVRPSDLAQQYGALSDANGEKSIAEIASALFPPPKSPG